MQHAGMSLSPAALSPMSPRLLRGVWASILLSSLVLVGCSTHTPAPITDIHSTTPSTPTTSTPTSSGTYTVQRGDTLFKIARDHNTTVQVIAEANQITDPSQLNVGQELRVPGASGRTQVASAANAVDTNSSSESSKRDTDTATSDSASGSSEATSTSTEPSSTSTAASSPKSEGSSSSRASDADLINWGWPSSGKVIQSFSTSAKGIDLEGAIGDPIIAAANGKVMYAGNGVRGLGNLILLGHSNGFITAYAHNDSLLVKTGDEITKGQKIATLGQSDTTSPRLHFEIRRRGTPVNPMAYLPSR